MHMIDAAIATERGKDVVTPAEPVHVGRNCALICPYLVQQIVWSPSF